MGCADVRDNFGLDCRALLQETAGTPVTAGTQRSNDINQYTQRSLIHDAPPHLALRLFIILSLNALLSGGILNGIAPLQASLVQKKVIHLNEAAVFYTSAFQIETVGTIAISGLVMGFLGARWTAALGLLLECVGHIGLVLATRPGAVSQRMLAESASGLIGLGGTALYVGSVSLAKVCGVRQGAVAGCLAGAWQLTSCGFMPLGFVPVNVLCSCYAIIALMAMPLVLWALPHQSVVAQKEKMCCSAFVDTRKLAPIVEPRMLMFVACFAWIASAAAWGTSVMYVAATRATTSQASREQFITWSPVAMLSSVFAPWLLGAIADRWGFAIPGLATIVMLCGFLVTIQSSEIWMLWIALLFLSNTVGSVYALQVVYLAARAPGFAFGPCLAMSVLAQSLVQIAAVALAQPKDSVSAPDLKFAAAVWAGPLVFLVLWPFQEYIASKQATRGTFFTGENLVSLA